MAMTESLFVYGSFCSGMVHREKIEAYIRSSQKAFARGSAIRLPSGYPVFIDEGDFAVEGECIELEGPEMLFKLLDDLHLCNPLQPEKGLFIKKEILVRREDQAEPSLVKSFVANLSKLPRDARVIENGDWVKSLQESPPLPLRLTERQSGYVRRLGTSVGREIVPIDLDLYRELMKLELIIDKGRRLALTKLGKEVYRYLGK